MADLLIKFDEFLEGQKETNNRLGKLENGISKVEDGVTKLNLKTAENTRAILKLADKVESIADLENRVTKIEKIVFK
jgi:uncharacterized coiled-coil protein SlyX